MDVDELKPGTVVKGSSWPEPITIKKSEVVGNYMRIVASMVDSNRHIDQMISQNDLANLSIEKIVTDFSAEPWKIFLSLESKRYRFASMYDPLLAMNTSKVDPLPHQIEAVYGHVLKMPRIRFLLAHDPGAGKTIMAGLIIKELKLRKVVNRILIVVPGHLKDQWSRELKERFLETFTVISRDYVKSQYGENVWEKENQVITSIDFAKQEDILPSLTAAEFDLIIVDEAHKMSAFQYGEKIEKTERYRLGEALSMSTEHLLLLTATPHRGDPENFRLFLDLLNPGFFKTKEMIEESIKNNDNPLFLRRMKEDMKGFDGKPLFVPRTVKTPDIKLSEEEGALYNDVSIYVKEQYDKSIKSDKKRHIGFALVILQRRMASSTHALLRSLQRRKIRLESLLKRSDEGNPDPDQNSNRGDVEDMSEEQRWREEEIWETLSLAENRRELELEIATLGTLISKAEAIVNHGSENKLTQLRDSLESMSALESEPEKKKILIFTESKDTLEYLERKIRGWGYSVNTIHGSMSLEERVVAEGVFHNDTQIMVATEAAGEGINLQFCHLMINYDLPWNPNRLEQRMGRIHRYGQQDEVTVFNLVAKNTREGEIMKRLFEKLDEIKSVMKSDKVFDVISEILVGKKLDNLMKEAATRTRSQEEILEDLDIDVDIENNSKIRAMFQDVLATKLIDYTMIRDIRNRAEENKLIPKYTEELFKKAFFHAGGKQHRRKDGFISIDSIPNEIKRIATDETFKKKFGAMPSSYSKATFDKEISFQNPESEFITFGNPLFEAMLLWIDRSFGHEMQRGAVFIDPKGRDGYVVFYEGEVRDGTDQIAGKKLFAYYVDRDGNVVPTDPGIIWDLEESGIRTDIGSPDVSTITGSILPKVIGSLEKYKNDELQKERDRQADIKRKYGIESLSQSIRDADNKLGDYKNRSAEGENMDIVIRNTEEQLATYKTNKSNLERDIEEEQSLTMSTPLFFGIIRVIPMLITGGNEMHTDPEVEAAGMEVAMQFERNAGRNPEDVSKKNLGFDIRSTGDDEMRCIEVKARAGRGTIAMSRNEWYQANQLGDSYYLYVVWDAVKPGATPIVKQNPAKNLNAEEKVVQYLISSEEISGKP